jgi:excinuclease UvrABC nuclease subunit
METKTIRIPVIKLRWSDWFPWERFKLDARRDPSSVTPPSEPGVYEARLVDKEDRLTIGKTGNLRKRIKQELVKGKGKHSTRKRLAAEEDTNSIVIRWATTDRPSATEEELHKQHIARFGGLPKHTERT